MHNKTLLRLALLPWFVSASHAAVIAQANFSGMTASNVTTVSPSAGANDFTWSIFDNSTGVDMDIVTDDGSPGIGGGNALQMDIATTASFRGMLGTMGAATTIQIGETLTLSLNGRYVQTPGNNGGGLRLGFTTAATRDNAFFAQAGTGGSTGFALFRDLPGDGSPGAGTVATLTSTASGETYTSVATDPFSAVFSVTRTGEDAYQIVASLNGAVRTATSVTGYSSFDSIFIRNGGIAQDLRVDNVVVTLVPEPTVAVLGGFAMLALLSRRRRSGPI